MIDRSCVLFLLHTIADDRRPRRNLGSKSGGDEISGARSFLWGWGCTIPERPKPRPEAQSVEEVVSGEGSYCSFPVGTGCLNHIIILNSTIKYEHFELRKSLALTFVPKEGGENGFRTPIVFGTGG